MTTLTKVQIDAIDTLACHAGNIVEQRNNETEDCSDCGADVGEHCDESCDRAALVDAINTALWVVHSWRTVNKDKP